MVCSLDVCSTAVVDSAKYRRCMIKIVFDNMKSCIAYVLKQVETALSEDKSGYSKIPLALHNWSRMTSLSSYKKYQWYCNYKSTSSSDLHTDFASFGKNMKSFSATS